MKSLQEAYNSIYSQQEDVVEEVNIYEEAYQWLLGEGYEDNDAIEIVNYLYENNSFDGIICEGKAALGKHMVDMLRMVGGMTGVWKPSAAAMRRAPGAVGKVSRALQGKGHEFADVQKLTKMTGGGTIGTRSVPNITQVSKKYGMDVPAPQPAWGGKPKDPWASPSIKLVNLPKSKKTSEIAKKVQAALPSAKELKALPPGVKGGDVVPSGVTAGLGPMPKVEPVKVRDIGSSLSSGGPTRYQGTRSGGQLPGGKDRMLLPAAGQTSSSRSVAGQTSSRRSAAAATAAAAAAGTTGTGVRQGMTSAIVKRDKSLVDKVKGALTSPTAKKLGKGAAIAGLVGLGVLGANELIKNANVGAGAKTPPKPKAPEPPKAPESPKAPSAPKATSPKVETPKVEVPAKPSGKKKMTKIDRDVEELMQMRASSMERQGRTDEADKLRDEIKAKYADYER